jgi:hypothetical protein
VVATASVSKDEITPRALVDVAMPALRNKLTALPADVGAEPKIIIAFGRKPAPVVAWFPLEVGWANSITLHSRAI